MVRRQKVQINTIDRLKLFKKRVIEFSSLRFIRSGLKSQFSFHFNLTSGAVRKQISPPDEEDVRSFILLFRQFISESEPIFINLVFNECLRFSKDDKLREKISDIRELWRKEIRNGTIYINVDGVVVTPEYALDLLINSHYFHNDFDKAAELKKLLTLPLPLIQMQFLSTLTRLAPLILNLGEIVAYGIDNGLFRIPE